MLIRTYQLRFVTPAFLGNAEQNGQWRTPPIKALLRQWWRVAYAADKDYRVDLSEMRAAEAKLFGAAADSAGASSQSRVRLRLDRWTTGRLTQWQELATVKHPEVRGPDNRERPVGSDLYLGYGPLKLGRGARSPSLKGNAAIQVDEKAEFGVAFADGADSGRLQRALDLMNLYGALGGRSRNGWGSFTLMPLAGTPALASSLDELPAREWRKALDRDWPHAIGVGDDGRRLVWQTEALADWKAVMRRLAEIKVGLRTQFIFTSGRNASRPEDRHWLSYPVTNHNVSRWSEKGKGDFRLPNSLRFKVRPDAEGRLHGVIFHVPCLPPLAFSPDRTAIESVWQRVHTYLNDPAQRLTQISA